MEIKGKIIAVLGQKSGTSKNGNAWKSQEYVIETDDQYPKKVCFSLWVDRIGQFNVQEGEDLTVSFDIDAKEWEGKWFNQITAWKVERQSQNYATQPQHQQAPIYQNQNRSTAPNPNYSGYSQNQPKDDLPF